MAKIKKKAAAKPVKKSTNAGKKKAVKAASKKSAPVAKKAAKQKKSLKTSPKSKTVKPAVKSAASKTVKKVARPAAKKQTKKVVKPAASKAAKPVAKAKVKHATKLALHPTVIKTNKRIVKPTAKVKPQVEGKEVVKPIAGKSITPQKKKEIELRTRYNDAELEEFRLLIMDKLDAARKELKYLQDQINRKGDNGTDDTENKFASADDGSSSMEREYLNQMAARQIMYMDHLDKALVRIQNKTYGICRVTGKLIEKERLKSVPHATLSMEAKLMQSH